MSTRPVIFISAVSKELRSARGLVARLVTGFGYDPKDQDMAATEHGPLLDVLRRWITESNGLIQLVGHCYGAEPTVPTPEFGRVSYTQFEALYAHSLGKPVYYLPADEGFQRDAHDPEPADLHALQAAYIKSIKDHNDIRHSFSNTTELENRLHRLKDDLAHLRAESQRQQRSFSQRIALALILLVLCVLSVLWLVHSHREDSKDLKDTKDALADLRQMLESSIKGGSEAKLTADYDAALRFIANKRGIPLEAFRRYLEDNATQALSDRRVALKDKVRALQEAGQFVQARDFAIEQARRLETERQKSSQEEVELWTEAAKTELTLGHYDKGLEYATKAVTQTDRQADFPTWSAARHQQGWALIRLRKDKEAQALYNDLIPLQQAVLGPDNLAVLQSRRTLAATIYDQGNFPLAEQQCRALVADCQRVLGAEHRDTLASRVWLANALDDQGKHAEAEQEYRTVLKLQERVLGAEHPDTLGSWMNLANALDHQGKHAEAEQEYRAVLKIQERVLGVEHPETLASWMNLALALDLQGKHAEAEQEYRAVLKIQERVLGAEHPDALASRMNLADALVDQGKHAEAEQEHRAVLKVQERVLGAQHPDTLRSRMNLANALYAQAKYPEAEQEYQAVLKVQERVLGAQHPEVARSCANLALCLEAQKKLPEALAFMQRAEQVRTKVLGPDHPDTKDAKAERERLEAALKAK